MFPGPYEDPICFRYQTLSIIRGVSRNRTLTILDFNGDSFGMLCCEDYGTGPIILDEDEAVLEN